MLVEEENGISDESNNNEKLDNNLVDSISITELNEDASTYMGVRSVAEEQSINMKKTRNRKKKGKKNQKNTENNKDNSNKKKRRKESFSSVSESKSSESSNEKRNSFTDLLKKKGKDEDKKNEEEYKKTKNNESGKKMKIEEVETNFEWEGSGKLVYVTGSFCDWKKFYIMTKNDKGIFSLTLSLPRGFHQYKFKVDENWTYSKIQPKYEDNGNVNNYIDTTDYNNLDYEDNYDGNDMESTETGETNENIKKDKSKSKKKEKEKEKEKDKHKKKEKKEKNKKEEKPNIEKKRNSSILSVNFLNSLNYYTIYYPLKSEFNEKPLSLPGLYKTCFILNEDFKEQQIRKFAEIEFVNNSNNSMSFGSSERSVQSVQSRISILGEVIPYVKFQNLYHIHSNHLHSKLFHSNENTVINSMTSRYRFKFSTFIYYKPNTPVEPVQRIKHSQTVRIKFDKKKRNEKKNII